MHIRKKSTWLNHAVAAAGAMLTTIAPLQAQIVPDTHKVAIRVELPAWGYTCQGEAAEAKGGAIDSPTGSAELTDGIPNGVHTMIPADTEGLNGQGSNRAKPQVRPPVNVQDFKDYDEAHRVLATAETMNNYFDSTTPTSGSPPCTVKATFIVTAPVNAGFFYWEAPNKLAHQIAIPKNTQLCPSDLDMKVDYCIVIPLEDRSCGSAGTCVITKKEHEERFAEAWAVLALAQRLYVETYKNLN
jgi:hypothetical protein